MFAKIAIALAATALAGGIVWAGAEGHLDPALSVVTQARTGVVAESEAGTEGTDIAGETDGSADVELDVDLHLSGEAGAGS